MKIRGIDVPEDLHVLVEHQVWARVEEPGVARVGITALGMALAGEIYMCRPKSPGSVLAQGQSMAVVELAKSIVSVKSPVGGTVIEVNAELARRPEWVHEDPHGRGWLARVQLADFAADAAQLVTGEALGPAMERHAWLNRLGEDEAGAATPADPGA